MENMVHDFLWAWDESGPFPLKVYVPSETPLPLPGESERLKLQRVPLAGRSRLARIAAEHLWLPGQLRRDGAEVLHAPVYITPVGTPCRLIVTVHDLHVYTHPHSCTLTNRLYYRLFMPQSLRAATTIVVYSDYVKRMLAEHLPQVANKVVTVPPGINRIFSVLNGYTGYAAVGRKFNLPQRYLLFVGDVAPRKNLPRLLRAFREIAVEQPDLQLVVAGQLAHTAEERLKFVIAALGLQQRVRLVGYVAREVLPALYWGAEVVALPSLDEGFGLPLLEALACGTAVVGGPGGAAEVCHEAVAHCDPYSVESITAALRQQLRGGAQREKALAQGLAQVQRFSWRRHVAAMADIYREARCGHGVAAARC